MLTRMKSNIADPASLPSQTSTKTARWLTPSHMLLVAVSLVGLAGFLYPFVLPAITQSDATGQAHAADAPILIAVVTGLALAAALVTITEGETGASRSRMVALLGVLVAIERIGVVRMRRHAIRIDQQVIGPGNQVAEGDLTGWHIARHSVCGVSAETRHPVGDDLEPVLGEVEGSSRSSQRTPLRQKLRSSYRSADPVSANRTCHAHEPVEPRQRQRILITEHTRCPCACRTTIPDVHNLKRSPSLHRCAKRPCMPA